MTKYLIIFKLTTWETISDKNIPFNFLWYLVEVVGRNHYKKLRSFYGIMMRWIKYFYLLHCDTRSELIFPIFFIMLTPMNWEYFYHNRNRRAVCRFLAYYGAAYRHGFTRMLPPTSVGNLIIQQIRWCRRRTGITEFFAPSSPIRIIEIFYLGSYEAYLLNHTSHQRIILKVNRGKRYVITVSPSHDSHPHQNWREF